MNVIIVEDERLSADHLSLLLSKIDPTIQVLHYFESVKQCVEAFKNGITADLIFLDIHLADGNSFEIFSKVAIETPIIFTTAYDQYAIQAFQVNSIDYLLKPIGIEELRSALNKFSKLSQQQHLQLLTQLTKLTATKEYKTRFLVKLGESISSIKTEEIHYFISEDGLVLLVNKQGKRYPVDYNLDQLEQILNPDLFFRINRKIILNIESVKKISNYFNGRLILQIDHLEGDNAIVSRDRVGDFKGWLS